MTENSDHNPIRAGDVPVTQVMLYGVRDELIERGEAIKAELKTELRFEIGSVRKEFGSLRGEVGTLRGEVGSLRGEIGNLAGAVHKNAAETHRLAVLIEEQNARNIVVLNHLNVLFGRQERVEGVVNDMKEVLLRAK